MFKQEVALINSFSDNFEQSKEFAKAQFNFNHLAAIESLNFQSKMSLLVARSRGI